MRFFVCHRDIPPPPTPPRRRPPSYHSPPPETAEDIAHLLSPVLHTPVDELLALSPATLHALRQQYVHIEWRQSAEHPFLAVPASAPPHINVRPDTPTPYRSPTPSRSPSNVPQSDTDSGDWTRRFSYTTDGSMGLTSLRREPHRDSVRSSWAPSEATWVAANWIEEEVSFRIAIS
jgi:hypothetical protein